MESIPGVKFERKKWIYFLRQLMVCSGVWCLFLMVGQFLGAPTVLVPQLRKEAALDDEMASWIYSIFGFAAAPWVIILSILTRLYGLRKPYIGSCVALLIAYIIFYFSNSPLQIIISDIVFGVGHASALTVGLVIISDYSSPKNRGMFLTFKSTSLFWGVWIANAIGTFFHWKKIAYTGFLASAYTFTFVFCPESPQWLASKGRFDECRKAFYWLQGHDEKTEKEVEDLIASQARALKSVKLHNDWRNFTTAISTIRSKEFYAPLLLTSLLIFQYHFAGKFVCAIYVVDILKKMTDSEATAYIGMLILDGFTVISMYSGCFLSRILYRRKLFLTTSFFGIAFLFIISLYLYLIKLKLIKENVTLSIVLLVCYSIAMGCGPMILSSSIYAELIPLRFKSVMVLIAALLFYLCLSGMLKLAPYIFKHLGMHGSFLFYGLSAGFCTVLLYKFLPETKDKTLQEIEAYFKTGNKESEMVNLNANFNQIN